MQLSFNSIISTSKLFTFNVLFLTKLTNLIMAKEHSKKYTVLMSDKTAKKVSAYKQDLVARKLYPGNYLKKSLGTTPLSEMTDQAFLQYILGTKKPRIFAESEIIGGGQDWNNQELGILGDISIAVPVTIYDNMGRGTIKVYEKPFKGELLYTPGCLLRGDNFTGGSKALPDYIEVIGDNFTGCSNALPSYMDVMSDNFTGGSKALPGYIEVIDQSAYNQLISRRLFPVLKYASERSTIEQKALINIPGLGCGQFAGKFQGKLGRHLNIALKSLLETHAKDLPNIALVRFDPYDECREQEGAEEQYGSITYRVRSLMNNPGKTQLCPPKEYEEKQDNFSQCKLFKVVAWDHVSLPGNDFWVGTRATDDGIAAAATNSMNAFATEEGYYDKSRNKFVSPDGFWEKKAQPLTVTDNLMVIPSD